MRWLLTLLLAPLMASAQTTLLPFALPSCIPENFGGTGKNFMALSTARGQCRGYWCPKSDGTWTLWSHCRLLTYGQAPTPSALNAALAASSPLAGLHSLVTAMQAVPSAADEAEYNALHASMWAQLKLNQPGSARWVVDRATAADGTRPAYLFAVGVRGTVIAGRAIAGEPCNLSLGSAAAGSPETMWAVFGPTFDPSRVALCRKLPPAP